MNLTRVFLVSAFVLWGIGLGLLWWGAGWKVALGVWVAFWAHNLEVSGKRLLLDNDDEESGE